LPVMEYELRVTDRSAYQALQRLGADMPKIDRQILGRVGQKVISTSQARYLRGRPGLMRREGTLAASLHYNFLRDDTILIGPGVFYGAVHEGYAYGRQWSGFVTIRPRVARLLRFEIGGRHIAVPEVHIPVRPWLSPALDDVFEEGLAERVVQVSLQQELDRIASGGNIR